MHRLTCWYDDLYRGIVSNTRRYDTDSGPPVFACRFATKPGYEEILGLANEDGQIALQDTTIKGRNNVPLDGVQVLFIFME